jgi:hypothetical protein
MNIDVKNCAALDVKYLKEENKKYVRRIKIT